MRICVLVPTLARPDDLVRCLGALDAQTRRPDEVAIVVRPEDEATAAALRAATFEDLAIAVVPVASPGQVAALNEGLAHARRTGADIVAITDDDAAPRPDWCARIERHLDHDLAVAGVGGRDWMHDDGGGVDEGSMPVVGTVQWFGRIIGGHQRGVGSARDVDVLKGANMAFRLSAIDGLTFDDRLRGSGAQIFNDFAFSLAVRARGGRLLFDPDVAVDHYPADRTSDHPRVGRSTDAFAEAAHNETLALAGYLGGPRLLVYIVWSTLVGSRLAPGLAHGIQLRLGGRPDAARVLSACVGARISALRSAGLVPDRLARSLRGGRGRTVALRRRVVDPEGHRVAARVRGEGLTYLEEAALSDLRQRVLEIDRRGVRGLLIEAGCARGGSAIVMASSKARDRPMRVYDVFAQIPEPGEGDGQDAHQRYATITAGEAAGEGGTDYYGYESDLLTQVERAFDRFDVPVSSNHIELIEGLYEDTLHVDGAVAMAHIDCDWYQSVMTCLERIEPHLSPGGVLVIDDYDAWSGCRRAVDEYFATRRSEYEFVHRRRLHIVRSSERVPR